MAESQLLTDSYEVYILLIVGLNCIGVVRYGLKILFTEQSGMVRYEFDIGTLHFGTFGTISIPIYLPVPDTLVSLLRPQ